MADIRSTSLPTPAATPTTLGLVRQQWLNARDAGAGGDAVADDTAAIQAAINTVAAMGTDPATPGVDAHNRGGTVFLPTGTYMVSQLTLYSHVRLRGIGGGTVLKQAAGSIAPAMIIKDPAARLCVVEHLRIDGNYAAQTQAAGAGPHGVWFDTPIPNYTTINPELFDAYDTIHDVFFYNVNGDACRLTGLGASTIDRVKARQILGRGIHIEFDSNVSGCDIGVTGNFGIEIGSAGFGGSVRLTNSKFFHVGNANPNSTETWTPGIAGVKIYNSQCIEMTDVEAQDCSGPGFHLDTVTYSVFSGCVADTCGAAAQGDAGFELANSQHNQFVGCTVRQRDLTTQSPTPRPLSAVTRFAFRERFGGPGDNVFRGHDGIFPSVPLHQSVASAAVDPNASGGAGSSIEIGSQDGMQVTAYAATYNPVPYQGATIAMTLTGNVAIGSVSYANCHIGLRMTLILTQDATGGHMIALDPSYHTKAGFAAVTAANGVTAAAFICTAAPANTGAAPQWQQIA